MQTEATHKENTNFISIRKPVPKLKIEAFEGVEAEQKIANELQGLVHSCLIDLSERLEAPPVAMEIMSESKPITLFTKGNFSIVTGAAKSRKTFLISMLMAAAILKGWLYDLFNCPGEGINIIFDTEQSRYKTQQIAKRICNLSQQITPVNFRVYSLRTLDPSQRLEVIDKVLENTPNIKFVAIDEIIDLEIDPILQADQAQRIVSKLMKWTEMYSIHIVCVLHYNKTVATLLGHLGSFSHRKADAVIEVSKSKEDSNVSLVKAIDCREREFEPFAFSVDQAGMPYILEDYTFEKIAKVKRTPGEVKSKIIAPADFDIEQHTELLAIAFKVVKEQAFSEVIGSIKYAFNKTTDKTIGDNKAGAFLTYYMNEGLIIKANAGKKTAVYILPGQSTLAL